MVRHGVGGRTKDTYEIKRIDEDWFDQEALWPEKCMKEQGGTSAT